jgi:hypothetical protein
VYSRTRLSRSTYELIYKQIFGVCKMQSDL